MDFFTFVLAVVGISATAGTISEFAKARGRGGGKAPRREVERLEDQVRELRAQVEELRRDARNGTGKSGGATDRLQALEQEVAELRDTTTKFDMSFDAGLDRVERRIDRLEERTHYQQSEEQQTPRQMMQRR